MKEIPISEWMQKGTELFGSDLKNWRFVCPACKRVNTGFEFMECGADPNDMFRHCIGRHNGHNQPPDSKNNSKGCNWTANGLFTLTTTIVITEEGKKIDVFDFDEGSEVWNENNF